jgi:hypothetical protein
MNGYTGRPKRKTTDNIGLAKWRVTCFYDSLVQGSSSVFQLNICAKKSATSPSAKTMWRHSAPHRIAGLHAQMWP